MAELSVSRKSVKELLSLSDTNSKGKIYVIPEYQRPYRWDLEKCETLWIDLTNFYSETWNQDDREYFLGTIVTCINDTEEKGIDVIDGQQRITSLFLLLRAFYNQLELMLDKKPDDDEVLGLMSSIEPCIWNVNKMSKKIVDKKDIHIKSLVATDKDNEDFHKILETGEIISSESFYAKNYNFFLDKCKEYARDTPMDWKELCLCILEKCIVLPIECEDLNSALTIFGTLNDRGLPLSDSDIFKSELYKQKQTPKEKEEFTQRWKSLEESVSNGGFSLDDLFRCYTHIIRGRNKDKSNEIGLRRFYAGKNNKYDSLRTPIFFEEIIELANFWESVNNRNDMRYCNLEAKKYIHCLNCYPNDYWKYPVSVFFSYHKKDVDNFPELIANLLKRLLAYLSVRFVESPTVNKIKDPIFGFCVEIATNGDANFDYKIPDDFEDKLSCFSFSKITKLIILLNSYLFDKKQELLPPDFDVEHIFPKKWQNTNYNGWTIDDAKEHLNMFGNKIAIEKKLNIQAGNGYFGIKKRHYLKSNITEVIELGNYHREDWLKEDINNRNREMIIKLKSFFEDNLTPKSKITETEILSLSINLENVTLVEQKVDDIYSYVVKSNTIDHNIELSMEQILENAAPIVSSKYTYSTKEEAIKNIPKDFFIKGIKNIVDNSLNDLIMKHLKS